MKLSSPDSGSLLWILHALANVPANLRHAHICSSKPLNPQHNLAKDEVFSLRTTIGAIIIIISQIKRNSRINLPASSFQTVKKRNVRSCNAPAVWNSKQTQSIRNSSFCHRHRILVDV